MHRLPFPFSLSVGTDIVHLPRIHRLITKEKGRGLIPFAKRILHHLEYHDLSRRLPRWQEQDANSSVDVRSLTTWLGSRFAAKEAARKALGATTCSWKDVRVDVADGSGEPRIICAIRNLDEEIEHEAKLSISHDGDYVVATVLAALPSAVASESYHHHARSQASKNW